MDLDLGKTLEGCPVGATKEFGDLLIQWEGTSPSSCREYAHSSPYTRISTLLFSEPLPGPRSLFYPAPCPHI